MTLVRKAIQVGNSVAVTLPVDFVKPGEELVLTKYSDSISVSIGRHGPKETRRLAKNEEVAKKFLELEKRYGKLYDDLAHIQ